MKRSLVVLLLSLTAACRLNAQTVDHVGEAKRLRDAHQFAAAAKALEPYLLQHPRDAGVHWLRSQLLYWSGRNDAASVEYEIALSITPDDNDLRIDYAQFLVGTGRYSRAREVLRGVRDRAYAAHVASLNGQISHATSPWARAAMDASGDDQVLHTSGFEVEAGFMATPSLMLRGRTGAHHFSTNSLGDVSTTAYRASAGARWSPEASRLLLAVDGGFESAPGRRDRSMLFTYAGTASSRTAYDVVARAGIDRHAYRSTISSIDTLIPVTSLEIAADRSGTAGVAGVVAARFDRYPDSNTVSTVFGWMLVPIIRGARAGVAASTQDTDESRWNGQRYDPYYTPLNASIVTALVELRFARRGNTLQVNGGYGIIAHDDAPSSGASGQTYRRSFTPWDVTGSMTLSLNPRTQLSFKATHHQTAFYNASGLAAAVYRTMR